MSCRLTADRLRISSLILSSFWWPTHGQTPSSPPLPDWSLINASCSLLNAPRIDLRGLNKIVSQLQQWIHVTRQLIQQGQLTLSLTVSFILAPALLATPEKNDPNDFAPAVTLLVTERSETSIAWINHSSSASNALDSSSIYYRCRPFRPDLPSVSLSPIPGVNRHHQLRCGKRARKVEWNDPRTS